MHCMMSICFAIVGALCFVPHAGGSRSAVQQDDLQLSAAFGGACEGLCATLACHNVPCYRNRNGTYSAEVGSGDYYYCDNRENKDPRCALLNVDICYTAMWNCSNANCDDCSCAEYRKPRGCADD